MTLTPDKAEEAIVERVYLIDSLRASNLPDREQQIARVNQEIKELKKITGPRHVQGFFGAETEHHAGRIKAN